MNLITRNSLQTFLEQLGHCFRQQGRLYRVGGSSLLFVNAKNSTFDVDFAFEVETSHQQQFISCLRQVSRRLEIAVEQAAPHQFIPLPQGYEQRHQFVGRFELLDVFTYDFYSVALSKLERGFEKDFTDVASMLATGTIEFKRLETYFEEILPRVDSFGLRSDSADFSRKFNLLRQKLSDR